MEQILEFIKPELLALVPALCFLGKALKDAQAFPDKCIPLALGLVGVVLAGLWVAGTSTLDSVQAGLLAVFTAIVQGACCAALAVYGHQLVKQAGKNE